MADLRHLGRSEGRRLAAELLERFDLVEAAHKPAASYSGGMRRRLDLAMTLVGDPCVIFLDEPSAGLDPRSRRDLWQIIRDLVAGGVTVFLTTQYLEEADQLADRIALLDQGHIVAEGTAKELKRLAPGGSIRLQFPDPPALARAATVLGDGERNDDALTLQVPSDGGVRSAAGAARPPRRRGDRGHRARRPDAGPRRRVPRPHGPTPHARKEPAVSSLAYAVTDSATMLRRNLRHAQRYPSMTISTVALPVVFLLLFNYVFGGTLGAGIRGIAQDNGHYIDFLAPGILVMTAVAGSVSTAVSVSVDMTEGIVNRFRTMAISRGSLLTGHVVGSLIQTMLAIVAVLGVALIAGFRAETGPARWAAAAGLLTMLAFALTWLAVALGMAADSLRDRQQPPTTAGVPAVPQQWLRPHRFDAHWAA